MEAAMQLGRRGYRVALAEATTTLGGRAARERLLPGLSAWGRVADHRAAQIAPMPNVETYLDSRLTAEDVLEMGFQHVAVATGARWRRDAVARRHLAPIPTDPRMPLFTPDDVMAGGGPQGGRVLLYDDDHFYMGSVIAEALAARGCRVDFVTPSALVAEWTRNTLEQGAIMRRLLGLGVTVVTGKAPEEIGDGEVTLACVWTGARTAAPADAVMLVTSRTPQDALHQALRGLDWRGAGVRSLKVIGDAAAPGPIAWATYAGRRYAEEMDAPDIGDALPFRRELAALAP
jgi:dimethylamine/trimethylamine dehydrogenase